MSASVPLTGRRHVGRREVKGTTVVGDQFWNVTELPLPQVDVVVLGGN